MYVYDDCGGGAYDDVGARAARRFDDLHSFDCPPVKANSDLLTPNGKLHTFFTIPLDYSIFGLSSQWQKVSNYWYYDLSLLGSVKHHTDERII